MSEPDLPSVDMAVVVLSCDKYSDLWPAFFAAYFRFWEGYSFPVYLCANKQRMPDPRVTTLLSGEDPDWSTSIRASLMQIDHDYVFLGFDDVFFDQPVARDKMSLLLNFLATQRPSYLRFRPIPKPDDRVDRNFGRYREDTLYRTSVFGIWNRQVLVDLLVLGESAWQFEINSPARARHLPGFFGVYENFISYIHGVEKGVWLRRAVQQLRDMGIQPDLTRRGEMTEQADKVYRWAMFREKIFNGAPPFLRPLLISGKRRVFKLLGR